MDLYSPFTQVQSRNSKKSKKNDSKLYRSVDEGPSSRFRTFDPSSNNYSFAVLDHDPKEDYLEDLMLKREKKQLAKMKRQFAKEIR